MACYRAFRHGLILLAFFPFLSVVRGTSSIASSSAVAAPSSAVAAPSSAVAAPSSAVAAPSSAVAAPSSAVAASSHIKIEPITTKMPGAASSKFVSSKSAQGAGVTGSAVISLNSAATKIEPTATKKPGGSSRFEIQGSSSSVVVGPKSGTNVVIKFKQCLASWNESYDDKNKDAFKKFANMTKKIMREFIFDGAQFDLVRVIVLSLEEDDGKVKITLNITFGPKLVKGIEEHFREVPDNETMNLCIRSIDVAIQGVTCKGWEAKSDECKKKCCNGGGGHLDIVRECTPEEKSKLALTEKKGSQCTVYCGESDCDSGSRLKLSASLLLVSVAVIIRAIA